jgi:hypothetical protein
MKLSLPIYWTQHFKTKQDKTVLVGMNWYRNAHYHAQNAMKQDFHGLVSAQIQKTLTPLKEFKLFIEIYYKNSSCDGANIAALIEKFTLDALQEEHIITNDNVQYHKGTTWEVVEQDKDNPRCVITITTSEV